MADLLYDPGRSRWKTSNSIYVVRLPTKSKFCTLWYCIVRRRYAHVPEVKYTVPDNVSEQIRASLNHVIKPAVAETAWLDDMLVS